MITFYDFDKLKRLSKTQKILWSNFELHCKRDLFQKHNFTGKSFIVNPYPLFYINEDVLNKIQYIEACSLRAYFSYKQYRQTYLDLSYYPEIITESFKNNPLITVKDNKLIFKFE